MDAFVAKIADAGFVNSLTQVVLKATVPGVPDFYQGCELWDFNLVDPDNRRPVDYAVRRSWLADLKQRFTDEASDAAAISQSKTGPMHASSCLSRGDCSRRDVSFPNCLRTANTCLSPQLAIGPSTCLHLLGGMRDNGP